MQQKQLFKYILAIFVVILIATPFFLTFSDVLTRIVLRADYFKYIQEYIIPAQIRLVSVCLSFFGIDSAVYGDYLAIGENIFIDNPFLIEIAWNCVGWQSFIFFAITALVGLQGNSYTGLSKLKSVSIGILGTFLANLLRIILVVLVSYYIGPKAGYVFHDYFSTFATVAWLFLFWWFSYSFVLEEKDLPQ